MLVLSRKTNESIVIDGKIYLDILRFEGDSVKVGVKAPKNVTVYRKEIYDERSEEHTLNSSHTVISYAVFCLKKKNNKKNNKKHN